MAIKGISEKRRLPRLGKIRLGVKVQPSDPNKRAFPKAVDYFVVPPAVAKVYGDQPKELDVLFPVEDENHFFPQFYKRYGANAGLLCKGDGEMAIEVDPTTGEMKQVSCNPETCQHCKAKKCHIVGNLQFMMPNVPGLGVYQIDTGSYNSIVNINSAITLIRALFGRIAMIPLKLTIEPMEANITENGKTFKKVVYVMNIRTDVKLEDIARKALQPASAMLLGPADETMEDLLYPEVAAERDTSQAGQGAGSSAGAGVLTSTPGPAGADELKSIRVAVNTLRKELGIDDETLTAITATATQKANGLTIDDYKKVYIALEGVKNGLYTAEEYLQSVSAGNSIENGESYDPYEGYYDAEEPDESGEDTGIPEFPKM